MRIPIFLAAVLSLLAVVSASRHMLMQVTTTSGLNLLVPDDVNGECTPKQIHLSLTENTDEMRVTWVTASLRCDSSVHYWATSGGSANGFVTVGAAKKLTESDLCSAPAVHNKFDMYIHSAVMTDLKEGEEYQYQLGGAGITDSQSYSFTLPPGPSHKEKLTFIGFGDMGEGDHPEVKCPGADQTMSQLREEVDKGDVDLILHVGDIAYGNGRPYVWETFMSKIQSIAGRVPYMVAVGNHEYDYTGSSRNDPSGAHEPYRPDWGNYGDDSGGECGVIASSLFPMPQGNPDARPPFWYAFAVGPVHFTVLSSEHDVSPGSEQHDWLIHTLKNVDRCTTPWSAVVLHRPLYVVYPHKQNRIVGEHLRDRLEETLLRYQVDFTISGHVHSYYRTCAVVDEKCVSKDGNGITHFVIGSGGKALSDIEHGQEDWCVAKHRTYGYGRFTAFGSDKLSMEFVASEDGKVLDEVTLDSPRAVCDGMSSLSIV